MTIHRTFLNHAETGVQGEQNTLPSETQPDMTMSLETLLRRHVQGKDIPTFEGEYYGEDEYIPEKLDDLTDWQNYAENNRQYIDELQNPVLPKDESEAEGSQAKNEREPLINNESDPES